MPINAKVLEPYSNCEYFIETGTHKGDGVQAALDVGFDNVWSIDLPGPENERTAKRFAGNRHVKLFIEDSRQFLRRIVTQHTSVFWLDAHACGGAGSYDDVPLLEELEIIASYPNKSHTILIDDVRLIGSNHLRLDRNEENISMWKLLDAINKINPNYIVRLIHSNQFNFDIIACTP